MRLGSTINALDFRRRCEGAMTEMSISNQLLGSLPGKMVSHGETGYLEGRQCFDRARREGAAEGSVAVDGLLPRQPVVDDCTSTVIPLSRFMRVGLGHLDIAVRFLLAAGCQWSRQLAPARRFLVLHRSWSRSQAGNRCSRKLPRNLESIACEAVECGSA
jgi:hypothetical protein